MKAVTVQPGVAGSVRFEEVPEPDQSTGSILVQAVAVGICGTDVEIASGAYGWAPPGGTGRPSATSRSAGLWIPGLAAACSRRPRRRDRPAPRPGALPQLRRR